MNVNCFYQFDKWNDSNMKSQKKQSIITNKQSLQ